MALKYALFDNPMTPDPDDRMAISQVNQSYTLEDVINQMISRGSTVTKAEALSVIEEFGLAIEQLVKDGNSVNTELFIAMPRIVGVFTNDDDNFDRSRHQVKLRIQPGKRLRGMERNIPVEKITAESVQPVLLHFHDNTSESMDEVITSGSGARITGTNLKFDEGDDQQGIFFLHENGTETRVTGKLLRNKPGELIFIVPAGLASGNYRVEVRSFVRNGSKTLKKGMLSDQLSVS